MSTSSLSRTSSREAAPVANSMMVLASFVLSLSRGAPPEAVSSVNRTARATVQRLRPIRGCRQALSTNRRQRCKSINPSRAKTSPFIETFPARRSGESFIACRTSTPAAPRPAAIRSCPRDHRDHRPPASRANPRVSGAFRSSAQSLPSRAGQIKRPRCSRMTRLGHRDLPAGPNGWPCTPE